MSTTTVGTGATVTKMVSMRYHANRTLAVDANGGTAGTIAVTARKPGASEFEAVPNSPFDLAALVSINFTGAVVEYKFVASALTGTSEVYITETRESDG